MLKMKSLFQNMLLILCLVSVTVVSSFGKEKNKEERRLSIKRILAATGVGSLVGISVAALLKDKNIGGSYRDPITISTALLGTVVGRLSVGKPTVKSVLIGVIGGLMGIVFIYPNKPKNSVESVLEEVKIIKDSEKAYELGVIGLYATGSVIGVGLAEMGMRKWEECKKKEINQEEKGMLHSLVQQ